MAGHDFVSAGFFLLLSSCARLDLIKPSRKCFLLTLFLCCCERTSILGAVWIFHAFTGDKLGKLAQQHLTSGFHICYLHVMKNNLDLVYP